MTLQTFVSYEALLREHNFQPTHQPEHNLPQNWIRDTDDPSEIQRLFVQDDGAFKAYRLDGNQTCHGTSAWELEGCFA